MRNKSEVPGLQALSLANQLRDRDVEASSLRTKVRRLEAGIAVAEETIRTLRTGPKRVDANRDGYKIDLDEKVA